MGHFDEGEQKERDKKQRNWEYRQRKLSGLPKTPLITDIQEQRKERLDMYRNIEIDDNKKRLLNRVAIEAGKLLESEQKKRFNGNDLKNIVLSVDKADHQSVPILRLNEVCYVMGIMVRTGIVRHIKPLGLSLVSEKQRYEL